MNKISTLPPKKCRPIEIFYSSPSSLAGENTRMAWSGYLFSDYGKQTGGDGVVRSHCLGTADEPEQIWQLFFLPGAGRAKPKQQSTLFIILFFYSIWYRNAYMLFGKKFLFLNHVSQRHVFEKHGIFLTERTIFVSWWSLTVVYCQQFCTQNDRERGPCFCHFSLLMGSIDGASYFICVGFLTRTFYIS